MSLKDTPEIDKPREKLMAKGASSLELEELIATILGRGTVGHDAVKIGKATLACIFIKSFLLNSCAARRVNFSIALQEIVHIPISPIGNIVNILVSLKFKV